MENNYEFRGLLNTSTSDRLGRNIHAGLTTLGLCIIIAAFVSLFNGCL